MLAVITAEAEVARSHARLMRRLTEEATWSGPMRIPLRAGPIEADGRRFRDAGLWSAHKQMGNRYWNAFGLGDPETPAGRPILVEVNPPKQGLDRRIGGLFLSDGDRIYLAHRGNRIGGGRKGIGKDAFRKRFGAQMESILDGSRRSEAFVIGDLDSPLLLAELAAFAARVGAFKNGVAPAPASEAASGGASQAYCYVPEFQGWRQPYAPQPILAWVDHGAVVDALHAALLGGGVASFNDQARDLFVPGQDGERILFEVKTGTSTSSIYGLIGQLMYHGAGLAERLMAVLPEPVDGATRARLSALGLEVLGYQISRSQVAFPAIGALLADLARLPDGS